MIVNNESQKKNKEKNNKIIVNDAIMNTKRKSITAIVIYITILMRKKTIGKFEKY